MNHRGFAYLLIVIVVGMFVPIRTATLQDNQTIKLGVVLSTNGSAGFYGQNARDGIELAVSEINTAGGINDRRIEIVPREANTNGAQAASVLRELLDTENIQVVIGDVTSTSVIEMAPIANARKVVLITPGASYPGLSRPGDFVFRYWYSDELEGKADAQYAKRNLNWTNVAIVYIDIAYGQGLTDAFQREFETLGGKVTKRIKFKQGQVEFSEQMKLLPSTVDGIFLVGYRNEMAEFLKALRASRPDRVPILSTQPFNNCEILERAGEAADGVIFSVPRPPASHNKVAEGFRDAFKRKYLVDVTECPRDFSETGYDSVYLVAQALKEGAVTATQIRDWLGKKTGFQGAFGTVNFNSDGDIPVDFAYKQVRNKKFEFLTGVMLPPVADPEPPASSWWDSTTAQLVATVLSAAIIGLAFWFFNRSWLWFWQQLRWYRASLWFWKERLFNRSRRRIVTLNDYVVTLEKLRGAIVKRCNNFTGSDKPTITVYSYTMQIPSDWPLWYANEEEVKQSSAPLERYFLGFHEFLTGVGQNYKVVVKRVIILDSVNSPKGQARLRDLTKDVKSHYFEKYIRMLHTNEGDALYYERQRPWPGWFTDSVFYALTPPGSNTRRWLWGVTTSYNAGEDLIILRLHRLGTNTTSLGKYLALPFPKLSIDQLAAMADSIMNAQPLANLKDSVIDGAVSVDENGTSSSGSQPEAERQ